MKNRTLNHLITPEQQQGLTLLELLVVVALFALVTAFALPNYRDINRQKQVKQLASQFENSLQLAQRQAFVNARTISICPTNNLQDSPITCLKKWQDLTESSAHSRGWIVFQDRNNNKIREENETLYRKVSYHTNLAQFSWTGRWVVIKVFPKSTSGSTGTMRVFSPIDSQTLRAWDSNNNPPLDNHLYETRISLSALGKITYKNGQYAEN